MNRNVRLSLQITCIILFFVETGLYAETIKSLRLSNSEIELEIVPRLSGRVVALRRPGGDNLLYVNPTDLQGIDESAIPRLQPDKSSFRKFYGHIIWLSPQTDWWRQQSIDPKAKRKGEMWPPDPWMEFDHFSIVRQSTNELVLKGTHSPISGVTLTKTFKLEPNASVILTVKVRNTGKKSVSWGIWSNTRVPASARVYVPVNPARQMRYELNSWNPLHERLIEYDFNAGFFYFVKPERFPAKVNVFKGKVGLTPSVPLIAAFIGSDVLLKTCHMAPKSLIAPGHFPIEIYSEINRNPTESVTELEFHGEYSTIAPGEEITFGERWQLLSARQLPDTPSAHTNFLQDQ
ncbi:MAG: DUF4380 domain-containing protein [Victivallales bacterium]|nr:DUF4380 domain-containing protein [Victivallales bacterium]